MPFPLKAAGVAAEVGRGTPIATPIRVLISLARGGYIYGPSAAYRCPPPYARTRSGDDRVDVAPDAGPYDAYCPSNIESPIMPPWRVLPWPKRSDAAIVVAAVSVLQAARQTTDSRGVGLMLDLFV